MNPNSPADSSLSLPHSSTAGNKPNGPKSDLVTLSMSDLQTMMDRTIRNALQLVKTEPTQGEEKNGEVKVTIAGSTRSDTHKPTSVSAQREAVLSTAPTEKLRLPDRPEKPASNPGGLFGDTHFPSTLPAMPVLQAKNAAEFNKWKTQAKSYFQSHGLSHFVLKPNKESLQKALADDQGNRTPYQVRTLWINCHNKIFGIIRTAVEAKLGTVFFDRLEALGDIDVSNVPVEEAGWLNEFKWGNAQFLWSSLADELMVFHPHDLAALVGNYLSLRFHVGDDPVAFNNKFESVVRDMEVADLILPDKLHMATWYRALPDELNSLKQTLSANPELTHQDIYKALVSHTQASKNGAEQRRGHKPGTEQAAAAIESQPKGKNQNRGKPARTSSKYCNHCQKDNHNQADCYKLKAMKEATRNALNSKRGQRRRESSDSDNEPEHSACLFEGDLPEHEALTCDENDDDGDEHAAAAMEGPSDRSVFFVFDSAATTHVVGDRRLLIDPQSVPELTMTTAVRGRSAQITTRGKIRLNKNWNLLDVAHLPNAHANLLSEARLCDGGYSIFKDKDFVRVCKDNKTVLMGYRVGRLWVYPVGGKSTDLPAKKRVNTLQRREPRPSVQANSASSSSPPAPSRTIPKKTGAQATASNTNASKQPATVAASSASSSGPRTRGAAASRK